ncbi:tRNA dihydrouridine synthase DusB [Desulfococcus multivorans]|uniref:tRNA-dihydrouridine synthase n=1 Tax=Desulfococcus multivorans DSM 2059 TaxID=1121405 RepID=S7UZ02_DESML|nr:tRNA dihydrouridine synthase DusB [Desulfococcus multivorans]AQV02323.1 tRNA dihydrouridine synthase DusB [Desulfococcus multivorans]EPR37618.1 TIM-barrel protein, nifR3 family [Desulfococcus multivorans DSM 2059]SKA06667.1 tRNA-U20-dihydrouridine synthase [Desulfococcus multivorans DSM 2059]
MKIGRVSLENGLVMAPLAGITNLPFRLLAKAAGCGLVVSEMISANGLVHGSRKTVQMLAGDPGEKPLAVQIFGADPGMMAEAAGIAEAAGADILDINFGCAVKKILKSGSGAALMRTPGTARAVLTAVRRRIRIPLTIKIRSGWDPSGEQAVAVARLAEECGVDAVAVHPRTAVQGFRGRSDWSVIAAVKAAVTIPVIGNGDIVVPEDALRMRRETGCEGIMVGRAAIGAPWLFSRIAALERGESLPPETLELRLSTMMRYLDASVAHLGEAVACRMMRSRLGWFVRGLPHGSRFRAALTRIETRSEALSLIEALRQASDEDVSASAWV